MSLLTGRLATCNCFCVQPNGDTCFTLWPGQATRPDAWWWEFHFSSPPPSHVAICLATHFTSRAVVRSSSTWTAGEDQGMRGIPCLGDPVHVIWQALSPRKVIGALSHAKVNFITCPMGYLASPCPLPHPITPRHYCSAVIVSVWPRALCSCCWLGWCCIVRA